jgi:hypothetical protein
MRFEAKTILAADAFDSQVPLAITSGLMAQQGQRVNTRLSGIVIFGVILALLGLGINAVVLEDFLVNSLGCLISTGGTLLVIGAFVVLGVAASRRKITNLGELYQHCDLLLARLDQVLQQAIPGFAARQPADMPQLPSAVALLLDSLEKQVADWSQKLGNLKQQRDMLGPNTPLELNTNIHFVQRELQRLEFEMANLRSRAPVPYAPPPELAPEPAE